MAFASRDIIINKNSTRIAGINSKSVNVGKTAIDTTTDEDNGYRTILATKAGLKTIDIEFSGVVKDDVLHDIGLDGSVETMLTDIELEFANGDTISGDFWLSGYTETGGGSDGSVDFSGTLNSSGAWTFTPSV